MLSNSNKFRAAFIAQAVTSTRALTMSSTAKYVIQTNVSGLSCDDLELNQWLGSLPRLVNFSSNRRAADDHFMKQCRDLWNAEGPYIKEEFSPSGDHCFDSTILS